MYLVSWLIIELYFLLVMMLYILGGNLAKLEANCSEVDADGSSNSSPANVDSTIVGTVLTDIPKRPRTACMGSHFKATMGPIGSYKDPEDNFRSCKIKKNHHLSPKLEKQSSLP